MITRSPTIGFQQLWLSTENGMSKTGGYPFGRAAQTCGLVVLMMLLAGGAGWPDDFDADAVARRRDSGGQPTLAPFDRLAESLIREHRLPGLAIAVTDSQVPLNRYRSNRRSLTPAQRGTSGAIGDRQTEYGRRAAVAFHSEARVNAEYGQIYYNFTHRFCERAEIHREWNRRLQTEYRA